MIVSSYYIQGTQSVSLTQVFNHSSLPRISDPCIIVALVTWHILHGRNTHLVFSSVHDRRRLILVAILQWRLTCWRCHTMLQKSLLPVVKLPYIQLLTFDSNTASNLWLLLFCHITTMQLLPELRILTVDCFSFLILPQSLIFSSDNQSFQLLLFSLPTCLH